MSFLGLKQGPTRVELHVHVELFALVVISEVGSMNADHIPNLRHKGTIVEPFRIDHHCRMPVVFVCQAALRV